MKDEISFQLIRCLIKSIADDKDELSREAFDKIFNNFVEVVLVSSGVDEKLVAKLKESSYQFGVPWKPTPEAEEQFKQDLIQKAKKSFPVIGGTIFRFFDRDGSGTISCDEIMFVVKLIVKLVDPSHSEVPFSQRLQDIAEAFFRAFDENNNGEIETSEVEVIIKDLAAGCFNILISMYDLFRSSVLGEHLDQIIDVYCARLRQQIGEEPFPLDKVTKFNVSFLPDDDENLPKMGEKLKSGASVFEQLLSADVQAGLARSKYNEFFKRFKEQAVDDKLGKAECVEIATACACEMFDAYVQLDRLEEGISGSLGDVNATLSSKLPGSPSAVVEKDSLVTVAKAMVATCRSLLLDGGLKRYLSCLFDMLDINNDGMLSCAELEALGRSINSTVEHGLQPGLDEKLAENQVFLYNLIDADSDGFLTKAEVRKFASKAGELVFAWIAVVLEMLRDVTLTALPSATALLFKVKAAVMGGSDAAIAMSDFEFLAKKMDADREADDAMWADKESVMSKLPWGVGLEKASAELKADKEVVMLAVSKDGMDLQHASSALKADKEVVLEALGQHGHALQYVDDELRKDREVLLRALQQRGSAWEYVPDGPKEDRALAIAAMSSYDPPPLYSIPETLKSDKEFMLAAVKGSNAALEEAPRELRADKEVVMASVEANGYTLQHASEALRGDKEVVLKAVTAVCGPSIEYASEALRNDREVVLVGVGRDGCVLRKAAEKFWSDREVVMLALQTDPVYDLVAAGALREDREIALFAASRSSSNFRHLPDAFKGDKAFVLEAIALGFESAYALPKPWKADKEVMVAMASRPGNGSALAEAADALRDDVDVILAVNKANAGALGYASDRLRADKAAVLKVVGESGVALEYADSALQDDADVVAAAVTQDWAALKYASERLRGEEEVVMAAMDLSAGQALRHGTSELRAHKDFVLRAVAKYGDALEYAASELREDREVVMVAVSVGGGAALGYASEELRNDAEVCKAATERNAEANKYVSKELGGGGEVGEEHVSSCCIS